MSAHTSICMHSVKHPCRHAGSGVRRGVGSTQTRGRKQQDTATPATWEVTTDLRDGEVLTTVDGATTCLEIVRGHASVWAVLRTHGVPGGIALRLLHCPGGCLTASATRARGLDVRIRATSPAGRHTAEIGLDEDVVPRLRWRATMTPAEPIRMPIRARDLFPLGRGDTPHAAEGSVKAAQRAMNTALVYFAFDQPKLGSALYVQDLTALNDFFRQSHTVPDSVVGGEWPELGYLPSSADQGGRSEAEPLPAGDEIVVSQGVLVLSPLRDHHAEHDAVLFLRLLAAAYPHLMKTPPQFRDWRAIAKRTVRDLDRSPKASVTYRRHRYIRPYIEAEPPDAMVQASLAHELFIYSAWSGGDGEPLARELTRGMPAFFDEDLGIIRRYLPVVEEDKDVDKVDSWYLYHPLINLARLALHGDRQSRQLFEDSLEYAVGVARHFDYHWPVMYNVKDWRVMEGGRDGDIYGQTDVNGVYAYVMLQAFELFDDTAYVDEAVAAIDASMDFRFELNYQANLTALGASACVRLWRVTGEDRHLTQAYAYLASFFHNSRLWETHLGPATGETSFLSPTCLHNAIYTAPYETFEAFAALDDLLLHGGAELEPAAQLLVSEFCAYAQDVTWWAYPENLPPECLAESSRDGHIDRRLAFPVEDVYADGQRAGQVGQEIYGAGAAFSFVARRFHRHPEAPFDVFCDRTVAHSTFGTDRSWSFEVVAPRAVSALVALLPNPRRNEAHVRVTVDGSEVAPSSRQADRVEYAVPGGSSVHLNW